MIPGFGLSIEDETPAFEIPEFCRILELPGVMLDSLQIADWGKFCAKRQIEWGIAQIFDSGLSRRLAEESENLRIEAFRKLCSRAQIAIANGAKWASLDLDISRCFVQGGSFELLRPVLQQLAGIFAGLDAPLKLLLPVRIPGAAESRQLLKFLYELPFPGMEFIFELHPHEPGALEFGGLDSLRFAARWWRICFDPGSGNKLSGAALSRFLSMGDDAPEELRVLFAPGIGGYDDFTLNQIIDTVEKWREQA